MVQGNITPELDYWQIKFYKVVCNYLFLRFVSMVKLNIKISCSKKNPSRFLPKRKQKQAPSFHQANFLKNKNLLGIEHGFLFKQEQQTPEVSMYLHFSNYLKLFPWIFFSCWFYVLFEETFEVICEHNWSFVIWEVFMCRLDIINRPVKFSSTFCRVSHSCYQFFPECIWLTSTQMVLSCNLGLINTLYMSITAN